MGGAGDVNSLAEKALTSPGVTVLTGPPGAGKTAVALELYRRRLDEIGRPGCLLIVPNAPAAEQTRRRLLDASPSALLISPAVATFAQLAAAVLSAAGTRAGRLGPAQRRLLLEAIVAELHAAGKLGALSPLADAPGLIDALDAAIAELKRAAVEPEALAKAIDPRSKKDADLLAVYRLYQQRLRQAGRFDLEGQMWLARDVLAGDDAPLGYDGITAVAADGFTDFTPTQLEMLAHLARRTEKLLITLPLADEPGRGRMWFWTARTLERIGRAIPGADVLALDSPAPLAGLFDLGGEAPPPPAGPTASVTIVEAPSVEQEVRAAARAIKADLAAGGGPQAVAVLARNLQPYLEPIQRIFAAHDIPAPSRPAALNRCGVVRYVLALAGLPPAYEFHQVLAVIRSSYFAAAALGEEFDAATVATAEMAIRQANVLGGRQAYGQAFERLARLARDRPDDAGDDDDQPAPGGLTGDPQRLEQAGRLLEALFAKLDRLASARDAAGYAHAVAGLIDEMGVAEAAAGHDEDDIVAADLRALGALDELLEDLAAADFPAGAAVPGGPAGLLARCAAAASVPPARGEALIAVADVLDARALRFRRVYLLGVNERAFPTLAQDRCFINEPDRAAWAGRGVVLDRRSDLIAREMLLFYLAATRAGEALTVSYLTADAAGKVHSPSMFVSELIAAAERQGLPCRRRKIGPGRFVPPAGELASPGDAFNAAISAAFGACGESPADAKGLLGWAASRQGELLARASFGLLAAGRRWARGDPDAFDGRIDDEALLKSLRGRIPSKWTFSASQFSRYAQCPWLFFASDILGLAPLAEPAVRMTPAQRGSFCHAVLWRVMKKLGRDGGVNLAEVERDELLAALDDAVKAETDRLDSGAVNSRLWAAQTRAWQPMLREYLLARREKAASDPERMVHFELGFGLAGRRGGQMDQASRPEPVELRAGKHRIFLAGKIDRVDRIGTGDAAGLLVVDYKTGRLPSAADVLTGHDLQLALYAQAIEAMLGEPCAGGAYHDVPNLRVREASTSKMPSSRAVAAATYEQWLAESIVTAGAYVDAIRAGRFDALPTHRCPSRCPFRQVCHHSEQRARRKAPAGREGDDE